MKPGIPWSVKGIDGKAREVAKDAARAQGKTLGEWLNKKILEAASEDAAHTATASRRRPTSRTKARTAVKDDVTASEGSIERKLDMLVAQLGEMQQLEKQTRQPQHALSADPSAPDEQAASAAMDRLLNRIEQGETRTRDNVRALTKRVDKIGDRVEEMALRPADVKARDVPGFSALEGAVRNIVDHIEKSEQQSREVIGQLQSRIVELDGKVEMPSPGVAKSDQVADLETRMKELSDRVEKAAGGGDDLKLKALFEARIRELAERIDSVHSTAESIGQKAEETVGRAAEEQAAAIESRIAGLTQQLEGRLTGAGASDTGLLSVQAEIDELHNRFDEIRQQAASDQELQALRGALEMLSSKVDEGAGQGSIAQIEQRIAELSQQLQQVTQPSEYQPQLGALEERVMALDNQIAASSSAAIPQMTSQMQAIEQRLTATEQQLGSLATIENSIQQLFASLEDSRAEMQTLAGTASPGNLSDSTGSSAELDALQQGLAAVRANAEAADQRTQATLEAVHETLAQIITKLGEVDSQQDPQVGVPGPNGAESEQLATDSRVPSSSPADAFAAANEMSGDDGNEPVSADQQPEHFPPDLASATDTADEQDLDNGSPVHAEHQSGEQDWLSVVRSHMRDNHGISTDTALSTPAQTIPAGHIANAADSHVDFIAEARRSASSGSGDLNGTPGEHEQVNFGAFDPHANEDDLEKTLFATASSRKRRSGDGKSGKGAGSSRKRLILAAVVLLAAVSAYATNSSFLKSIPSQLTSDVSPALTTGAGNDGNHQLLGKQAKVEMDGGNGAAGESATGRTDRMESDPMTTSSVASAGASDPLLSHTPLIQGEPLSSDSAVSLPEQIGTAELRQAAINGNASAQFIIASRFLEGRKVGRDHARAAYWYTRAAQSGLATAQYRIGTLYERGRGVKPDRFQAMSWYAKAANQGNVKAMHNLAVMAADTANGKPDLARAAKWFGSAANHGLPDSQYNFAVLNERGLGVRKNQAEAYKWYSIAALSGDRDAFKKSEELNASLDKVTRADIDRRVAAWRPAAPHRAANKVSVTDPAWGVQTGNRQAAATAAAGKATGQQGSKRDTIKQVQQLLTRKGFDTGTPDGEMDATTANAIRLYQLQNGMLVNGIVSRQLLEHLQRS